MYISAKPFVSPSTFLPIEYTRLFNSSAAFLVKVKATMFFGDTLGLHLRMLTILLVTTPVLPAPAQAIISTSSSIALTASICFSDRFCMSIVNPPFFGYNLLYYTTNCTKSQVIHLLYYTIFNIVI